MSNQEKLERLRKQNELLAVKIAKKELLHGIFNYLSSQGYNALAFDLLDMYSDQTMITVPAVAK